MPFAPLPGYILSVGIGDALYAFDKCEVAQDAALADVSNFTGGGFSQFVQGLQSCKFKLSGPFDQGNMLPFAVNSNVTLIVTFTGGVTCTSPALVKSCTVSGDVKDAQRIALEVWATGSFDLLPL